jgi:hypothetical protein
MPDNARLPVKIRWSRLVLSDLKKGCLVEEDHVHQMYLFRTNYPQKNLEAPKKRPRSAQEITTRKALASVVNVTPTRFAQ